MKPLLKLYLFLAATVAVPAQESAFSDWLHTQLTHPLRYPVLGIEANLNHYQDYFSPGLSLDLGWAVMEIGYGGRCKPFWVSGQGGGVTYASNGQWQSASATEGHWQDSATTFYYGLNPIALVNGITILPQWLDYAFHRQGTNPFYPENRNSLKDLVVDGVTEVGLRFMALYPGDDQAWYGTWALGVRIPGPWIAWKLAYEGYWGHNQAPGRTIFAVSLTSWLFEDSRKRET